jgi:Zn-finger nucleic acid-binding protein
MSSDAKYATKSVDKSIIDNTKIILRPTTRSINLVMGELSTLTLTKRRMRGAMFVERTMPRYAHSKKKKKMQKKKINKKKKKKKKKKKTVNNNK